MKIHKLFDKVRTIFYDLFILVYIHYLCLCS